jgi:hypothetical protein
MAKKILRFDAEFFIKASVILIIPLAFLIPISAKAEGSSLYIAPSTGTYVTGEEFIVSVKLSSGEESINSAEGSIRFDSAKIEVSGINTDSSIFNFWFPSKTPTFSNAAGNISFSGGLPSPGFKGSSGHLFNIKFKAKAIGSAQLNFISGSILANDGKGSNILTAMGNASYQIAPESKAPVPENPKDEAVKSEKAKTADNQNSEDIPANSPDITINDIISSPTHPDQSFWYPATTLELKFKLPKETESISTLFDQSIESEPKEKAEPLTAGKNIAGIKDGVWYFHLRYKNAEGWSRTNNFRVQIDNTPPELLEAYVEQKDQGNWPTIFFKAKDGSSGIKKYEIKVGSLEEKGFSANSEEASIITSGLSAGEHKALVEAIDNAGNITYTELEFSIQPIESPKIENFPIEAKPSDKLFFSGKSLPNAEISINIENENGKIISKQAKADSSGNWFLLVDPGLTNGRYLAWAQATNENGLKSQPTSKVSFFITPPIFARIGNVVINYFTVLASLLFMIILIVFSVVFLVSYARKKLRKETYEIEKVLKDKLETLKKEVDDELVQLAQSAETPVQRTQRSRAKERLKVKIEVAEKKILKEIKDVEDIIK